MSDILPITIRDESPDESARVRRLIREAFRDAPHAGGHEHRIVDALRRDGRLAASIVAVEGELVVGQAAASPVTIDGRDGDWFGLGPVAVDAAWRRRGVGAAVVGAVLDRLRERGAAGCVVLGDPAYYARFGFRVDARLVLPGVPPKYFQALRWTDSAAQGVVAYHASFYDASPEADAPGTTD